MFTLIEALSKTPVKFSIFSLDLRDIEILFWIGRVVQILFSNIWVAFGFIDK